MWGALSPLYEVCKEDTVGIALPPDLGRLQDARVAQLNQDFLPVELAGLPVIVGLDAADKMGLPRHHL